jgi:hypothetical protein
MGVAKSQERNMIRLDILRSPIPTTGRNLAPTEQRDLRGLGYAVSGSTFVDNYGNGYGNLYKKLPKNRGGGYSLIDGDLLVAQR